MKNFIAGIAILILLVVFPLQNVLEVVNDHKISKFDEIVYRATQTARTDGYFTAANIAELKDNIIDSFSDVSDSDIYINVTTTPKYRLNAFDEREVISYEISIPVKKIVIAGSLFGINDADNQYRYSKKGYVLSEVLMP